MKFDSKQKFSIRKYSIGAASVLIGTMLVGGVSSSGTVQADEVSTDASSPSASSATNQETTADLVETTATEVAAPASQDMAPVVEDTATTPAVETASSTSQVVAESTTANTAASTAATTSEAASTTATVATSTVSVTVTETSPVTTTETATAVANPVAPATDATQVSEEDLNKLPKVVGLDTEAAVINEKGGVTIPFTQEAQEQYQASLEAYMVTRRNNLNRRGSGFRNVGNTTTEEDAEYEFKKVMTPVLPGYYADKASVAALVVTPENIGDYTFDVWYKKLGFVVFVDEQGNYISPEGNQVASRDDAAKQKYANDQSDPTRAWITKVPNIPTGWEMVPNQTIYGYNAERNTVNPNRTDDLDAIGKDTLIQIRKQTQKAIVNYVNEKGNTLLAKDEVTGKSGEAIDYSTAGKISELRRQGYELVSDGFTSAANKNFDFDTSVDQEFTVVLRERIEPVDPNNPNPDPTDPVDPKDPDTPKWPDSVKNLDNHDDVKRTINYVFEDGSKAAEDATENLHFQRVARVNLVTGEIVYDQWTTNDNTFDAVTSPTIKGYTPDKAVVAEVTGVVAGTPDSTEVVTYVKDAQKAIIKYVNENGNVELAKDEVAGKSGETIDYTTEARVSELRRQGYELVSDGFRDAADKTFDFDASVDQEFTVVLRERIEPVDPDQPKPDPKKPVDPKDPDTPKWPDSVKDIENKDSVTRTVKYVYEDGSQASADVAETLNFKRFAYVNLVTGAVEYREWTTNDDTFDAVTSPAIQGYTPDKAVVAEVTGVVAGTPDSTEVVTYVKDAQKAIIKYVNENGNLELAKDEVAGKSGEAINYSTTDRINELKRKGYELVSDGFTKDGGQVFDFDASVDQEFTVTLKERIEPVDPDQPKPDPETPVDPEDPNTPKWPDTVKDIENKDSVTRTVKYVYEDGSQASADVAETLNFKRFAYVNLVTGNVEYREWTTNDDTFDAVTSPAIQGYTADKAVVAEVTGVKAGAEDIVEVVTYVKDAQKAIIKYVNENGNLELAKDEVAGKSGEAINYTTQDRINELKRKGYEVVSDGFTKDGGQVFDFDASVDQEFTVTLKERIEPVDPDQPKPDPETPVNPEDPNTPNWPDTVKDIENKDSVTRTVKYVYEDGSQASADVAETLNFKRFAYVNLVTGNVEYREWTTNDDTFDAVTSPAIQGYTPDKAVVAEVTGVKAGAEDIVEVVTYVKDAQKALIKYVNENGNLELAKDEVAGKSGEAINYSTTDRINELKRKGYELVSDGFTKDGGQVFDFDASVDQEFTVTLKERIEPVDPDQPKPDPETPVDPEDPNTPKWPDTVKDIENKDSVTRTIKYVYEDGSQASADVAETLNFKRFAYVNLVTGNVEYREWTTNDDTFDAVTSPAIQGYTPDKAVVAEVTGVKAGAEDIVEVVTYVKDAQKAIIKYVNENGNVELAKDEVAGKSGEAINYTTQDRINELKRKGYEVVSDGFTKDGGQVFDFDASVDQEFTVTLKERIEPVDPDQPKPDPETPVDPEDPNTPNWPDTVKDIENKDSVTRTVKYVYEDGSQASADVAETLNFKRFAYVNLVTGNVEYREWTTNDDTFDAVTSPTIKGYTADKAIVAEVTGVKAGAEDIVEVVTYVKDAQKAIIKYVNENGQTVVIEDTVEGKSGEAINYSTQDRINELRRRGYELVSDGFTASTDKNFDFDQNVDQVFTVVVRERVVPVGPTDPNPDPNTPFEPTDPNTPNWPQSVEKIASRVLNGTRQVRYFDEDTGRMVLSPVKEAVVFHRTILVNLVTGEMTVKPWVFVSATPIEAANTPAANGNGGGAASTAGFRSVGDARTNIARLTNARLLEATTDVAGNLNPVTKEDGSVVLPTISSPVVNGMYTLVKEVEATTFNPVTGEMEYNYDVPYRHLGRIEFVDQNGNPILDENGQAITAVYNNDPKDPSRAAVTKLPAIPAGYSLLEVKTISGTYDAENGTVDPNNADDPNAVGKNTTFILVKNPEPEKPVVPTTPEEPAKPETPVVPEAPQPQAPANPETPVVQEAALPETGSAKDDATLAGLSALVAGLGLGYVGRRRKKN